MRKNTDLIYKYSKKKIKALYKINEIDFIKNTNGRCVQARSIFAYCLSEHAEIKQLNIEFILNKSKKTIYNYICKIQGLLEIDDTSSIDYKQNKPFIEKINTVNSLILKYIKRNNYDTK